MILVPDTVSLDAFLQTSETHMELCRALKTMQSADKCHFRIRINKLDVVCLGVARITVLLELVDVQVCVQKSGIPCAKKGSPLPIFLIGLLCVHLITRH